MNSDSSDDVIVSSNFAGLIPDVYGVGQLNPPAPEASRSPPDNMRTTTRRKRKLVVQSSDESDDNGTVLLFVHIRFNVSFIHLFN